MKISTISPRMCLCVFASVLFVASGIVCNAQSRDEAFQTLTGKIIWRKSMGVPPPLPGSNDGDICSSFWVALLINASTENSPAGYDNKLQRTNDPFLPDHYVCSYSVRATADRNLTIRVGMGDVFQLPKPAFLPAYYNDPWTDEQGARQSPPPNTKRGFAQDFKEIRMGRVKGTYLKIELRYIPK